jgi:DinB superfamily
MINEVIKATEGVRSQYTKILEAYSIEQINTIPPGFNNNLLWNVGHAIAVQQMIVYGLAGQDYMLDKAHVLQFKRGTKPEFYYDQSFVDLIKDQLLTSMRDLRNDIEEGQKFATYANPFTAANYTVHDLGSALVFNLFHESMHLGHMQRIVSFL